jgi:hypothetical protein
LSGGSGVEGEAGALRALLAGGIGLFPLSARQRKLVARHTRAPLAWPHRY